MSRPVTHYAVEHVRNRGQDDEWRSTSTACRRETLLDVGINSTDKPDDVTCKLCRKSYYFPGNAINYRGRY